MFKTVLFPIDQSREAREASGCQCCAKVRQSLSTAVSVEEVVDSEESPSAEVMASADAVAQLLKMPNLCSLRREFNLKPLSGKANPPL